MQPGIATAIGRYGKSRALDTSSKGSRSLTVIRICMKNISQVKVESRVGC